MGEMPRTQYPSYDPALRIAVLEPDLGIQRIRRRMARARAVAASASVLRELAEAVESGIISLPPIEAAVIVLTGICHGELTDLERDLFWRVFQVPIFEQFLSPEGRILAMECDAHDGMHLLDPADLQTLHGGVLETAPCGCGNPHPRLIGSETPPRVSASVAPQIYENGDQQEEQVNPARRVA